MEQRASRISEAWKKKVHWETTLGQLKLVVQRFLNEGKLIVPFCQNAEVECRDYSVLLERVVADFGADVSFGQAAEKLREHYGITLSLSAVQSITKRHAKGCHEMLEETETFGRKESKCLISETDGTMIPILFFEAKRSPDKRKWRKTEWKEARLCLAREHKSFKRVFLATMGSTEKAGDLLGQCAQRMGWNEKTKIHCIGDGARWISEQVERIFGTQGKYLIDFFHLSEYLGGASERICKEGRKKWLKMQQKKMKQGRIGEVLKELKKHLEPETVKDENAPVRRCYRYMENRPGQFEYQRAIKDGLPIGSGEIESGNKSVVQKRLKIPGAWWRIETAEQILALRCVRINGDWRKYWQRVNPDLAWVA